MTPAVLVILLPLGAAVLHATWNTILKSSGDRLVTVTNISMVAVMAGAIMLPFVGPFEAALVPWLILTTIVHTLYKVLLAWAYDHGDLSRIYPLARGIAPVLVAGMGWVFFDEVLSTGQLIGIAVVSAGILILATEARNPLKGTVLALLTGICIATYSLIDAQGVRAGSGPAVFIAWMFLIEPLPMAGLTVWRRWGRLAAILRRQWKRDMAAGAIAIIGYGSVMWAFAMGATAGVVALRETSVILAAALGAWYLNEGFGPRRVGAAVLVAAGVLVLVTFRP